MSSGEKSADVHDAASVKSSRSELDKAIDAKTEDVYTEGSLDPVYQAKATILNDALQEIGMGKYQVRREIAFSKFEAKTDARSECIVVLVCRCWIWMAFVSLYATLISFCFVLTTPLKR